MLEKFKLLRKKSIFYKKKFPSVKFDNSMNLSKVAREKETENDGE